MNRTIEAYDAAQRILDKIEKAGLDIQDTEYIIHNSHCLPDDIYYGWGASRLVLWDIECDYVIKIARRLEYEKFNQHEVEVYAAAVENDLSDYFGWCVCYTEPTERSCGVYVMEYLEGEEDEVCNEAYWYNYNKFCNSNGLDSNSSESREEYENNFEDEKDEILEYIKSNMTLRQVVNFENLINDYDVNDLHSGNVLFKNERLVFCDYAGWGW